MSYCRFSCMNFRCDVYVYADCYGGWTTHVAGRRLALPPIPEWPVSLYPDLGQKWDAGTRRVVYPSKARARIGSFAFTLIVWFNQLHRWSMDLIPLRRISLPHAGERFNDENPGDCADRLEALRKLGYVVPKYAIAALREEARAQPPAHPTGHTEGEG